MAKFYSSAVPEYQADKEQFEFVQMKDDIADATFQDKPIGFFKDAMLRFCRSKVSIVAFVGIVIILFMAIFMPMMSHWHYNDQDLNRINLPPKMPVLENVGILDGTRWLTNRRVDSLEDTTRYPEGSILKVINYRKVQGVDQFGMTVHVETVVLLSKGMVDSRKVKVDFSLEDMDLSEFKGKATYEQIKAYVLEQTGLKVSSLYIAQIKKKCGLDVGENFNLAKLENVRQPQCTPEKEDAIMQAFRHFGII